MSETVAANDELTASRNNALATKFERFRNVMQSPPVSEPA